MDSKIVLLCGLPGSGKTTFAEQLCKKLSSSKQSVLIHDIDSLSKRYKGDELLQKIKLEIYRYGSRVVHIIDGLFLTNEDYAKILSLCPNWNYELHYWIPDRESCLYNDKYRRNENSKITILHAKFEQPSEDLLNQYDEIKKVEEHKVNKKNGYQLFKDRYNIYGDYIKSDSWSMGGSWGNCWGDSGTVSADNPPTIFIEFDKLIEQIAPDISFMRYKRLYNETVVSKTRSEGDYYGGSVDYGYYECDVRKLYELLIEMNLLHGEFID